MKEIRAIIRPKCLNHLRGALREIPDFPGVTVFKGAGFSAPGSVGKRTVREELTDFTEKILISVIAHESMVNPIAETILRECQTGHLGDGVLWILPLDGVQCIRDGAWLQALTLDTP